MGVCAIVPVLIAVELLAETYSYFKSTSDGPDDVLGARERCSLGAILPVHVSQYGAWRGLGLPVCTKFSKWLLCLLVGVP